MSHQEYGNPYPVYAASSVKIGGLEREDMLILIAIMTVCDQFLSLGPQASTLIGGFAIWRIKKATEDQAPGLGIYSAPFLLNKIIDLPFVGAIAKWFLKISQAPWYRGGSLPPPVNPINYEP